MIINIKNLLPKETNRFVLPALHGSSDAFLLSQAAKYLKAQHQMLVVVVSSASRARRLIDEVEWFNQNDRFNLRAHLLPDWETLPYDTFSPHQDLVSNRLSTFYALLNNQCDILFVSATTALGRIAPPSFLAGHTFFFNKNDAIDEQQLKSQLVLAGYNAVTQVMSPGEYAIRGGLIDLFPMGATHPFRLDLFDNEIESIKTFDVDSQRTIESVDKIRILPGHEFSLDPPSRTYFRSRWRETFEGNPAQSLIYKDMEHGIASAGIEYYLPLFFEKTATLFDFIPAQSVFTLIGDIDDTFYKFWGDTNERYHFLTHDKERPPLPPKELFLTSEEFFSTCKNFPRWVINKSSSESSELSQLLPDVMINRRLDDPLVKLKEFIATSNNRILISAESPGRRETMQQLFDEYKLPYTLCETFADFISSKERIHLCISPLYEGFCIKTEIGEIAFITESELYANFTRTSRRQKNNAHFHADSIIRDLSELKIGDPVVHIHYGVGRYQGLVNETKEGYEGEYLKLMYAHNDVLYIPVAKLHVISRYAGASSEDAPLHTLGSGQWEKARAKAAAKVYDTAAELLDLYAKRSMREGFSFTVNPLDYERFVEGFGFEETPDQSATIASVIEDMASPKPMDRLICGDVGFGKTEVALRAAFIAVMNGQQVALLAPTTLLAEQHAQTFRDRFADWPVKIAELSRFRTQKEIKKTIDALKTGDIDIVIGTHKLLSPSVQFKRLGLIIIDEEHRFGVRQKEALKQIRTEVDVLTLTATPIPRTLSMALDGLRNFSVIATAPQKRLAIKTFIRNEDNDVIREACLRELKRGGQVYFLHNEVDTIENRREQLQTLLPEANIGVAHGQMHERDLERVMKDFVSHRYHILVCTTIIETGIDVPNANTMIMHRADKFGLAQLHQLRGRIGRSHHQAYAYLLVNDKETLSKQSKRRLEAIHQMEELGSGFYLAMHDLEIRGAGEVLGEEQSGEMIEVGFKLYSEMLKEAVRAIRNGEEPDYDAPLKAVTEINLHTPALLPDLYCYGVNERLSLYKRFANCETEEEITYLREELVDRFGKLPDQAIALVETHRLRLIARAAGIIKIDANKEGILIQFEEDPPIDALRVIELVQKNKHIRFNGPDKIHVSASLPNVQSRVTQIKALIQFLNPKASKKSKDSIIIDMV